MAAAQSGYNYQEWGVGGGLSYERGYTNITYQNSHIGFNLNAIYNFNPYLPIEFEIQKGTLSGGGVGAHGQIDSTYDDFGRFYTNNYIAAIVHADFQLGGAIDYGDSFFLNIVKNFYLGTGFGVLSSSNVVNRYAPNDPSYKFPGSNSSINLIIPIRFGYEFKIYDSYNEPSMALDIGYIHSLDFGEGLDGYNDPSSKFKNDAIDQYRQITVMFKFFFGNVTSYNKLIRPFGY
jgi:hypothetical protein